MIVTDKFLMRKPTTLRHPHQIVRHLCYYFHTPEILIPLFFSYCYIIASLSIDPWLLASFHRELRRIQLFYYNLHLCLISFII
jgi:hypothetical protein